MILFELSMLPQLVRMMKYNLLFDFRLGGSASRFIRKHFAHNIRNFFVPPQLLSRADEVME